MPFGVVHSQSHFPAAIGDMFSPRPCGFSFSYIRTCCRYFCSLTVSPSPRRRAWPPWSSGFSCIRILVTLPPPVGSLLRLVRQHAQSSRPAGGFLRLPLVVVFRLDSFCHFDDELPMGGVLHFPASAPFGIACLRRSVVLRHHGNALDPSGSGDSYTFLPFGATSSA